MNSSLKSDSILRRHLITGMALLILPMLLLHQTGTASMSQILGWAASLAPYWLLWGAVMIFSSWLAFYMADRLIWPGWMRRINIDLYDVSHDGLRANLRDLFRRWATCWRCLGYWYGGIASFLLWLVVLPVWYGAFYFALAGASLGAAITALFVTSSARE
jgi:hypothetical protein